ncbi:MAG: di-heme oxidoredictase family protein [Pseudomonadota bacterium]
MKVWGDLTRASALLAMCVTFASACGGGGGGGGGSAPSPPPAPPPPPEPPPVSFAVPDVATDEHLAAGDASISLMNEDAFGASPESIQRNFRLDATFKGGNAIFRNDHEGEGPLLNARTCQGCHIRDGRGSVPADTLTPMDSMSIRLSTGVDAQGAVIPDPIYGTLLQTFGLDSFRGSVADGLASFEGGSGAAIGEGFGFVEYESVQGNFNDGTAYELRKPTYKVRDLSYGDLSPDVLFSPRIAPSVFGLGLLEVVSEDDIRELADPNDADGNGISGRVNEAFDVTTQTNRLGRIGLKATVGSLLAQTSGAYVSDMGVTSSFVPDETCTTVQTTCLDAAAIEPNRHPGGANGVDISDVELAFVEFYVRLLAVPQRRGFDEATQSWDEGVLAGRTLFFESGCGACHHYSFTTGVAPGSVLGEIDINVLVPNAPDIEVLSGQRIYPYSDMLLHDMGGSCDVISRETEAGNVCGAGENCFWVQRCEGLADGRPEGLASGAEWRTTPLWGLGLVKTVNPNATFLHDGRARNISEAILWHGGEGEFSRDAYLAMSAQERDQLLGFLDSL